MSLNLKFSDEIYFNQKASFLLNDYLDISKEFLKKNI